MLTAGQQQPQPSAQTTHPPQPNLQSIFSHYPNSGAPAAPLHAQLAPQAQPAPQIDPSILAALNAFNQQQVQQPAPYVPAPPAHQPPDLSSILARISQQPQQQAPANQPQPYNYQDQYQQDSRKRPYDSSQQLGHDPNGDSKRGKANSGKKHVSQSRLKCQLTTIGLDAPTVYWRSYHTLQVLPGGQVQEG